MDTTSPELAAALLQWVRLVNRDRGGHTASVWSSGADRKLGQYIRIIGANNILGRIGGWRWVVDHVEYAVLEDKILESH